MILTPLIRGLGRALCIHQGKCPVPDLLSRLLDYGGRPVGSASLPVFRRELDAFAWALLGSLIESAEASVVAPAEISLDRTMVNG